MTEPRKLKRGQNSWTAVVDAARAALGDVDPRSDGGRIVGDPVSQVLGAAVSGLGGEHQRRRGDTLHSRVFSAARQAPAAAAKPAAQPVAADDQEAAAAAWAARLDQMEPAERAALESALDAAVAVELGLPAESEFGVVYEDEFGFDGWEAA